MRKSKLALLAGALLTIFTLFSCQQPETPGNNTTGGGENTTYTVKFDDNGTIIRTLTVKAGATISASSKPSNPSKDNNYFMYWSESKASIDKVKDFDLTQPITKNTTLYAIYTPNLDKIHVVTSEKIVIKLSGTNTYPLDDGSYPEIKISYSTDSKKSYKELSIFKPSKTEDILENNHAYKYLTYNFETPLSYGDYDFKVVSKYEFAAKEYKYSFDQNKRHVYFDDKGSITKKTVDVGSTIVPDSTPASGYAYDDNYFMYWSESKSSLAEAVEFDFSQPITKDTVLYAIYTPKLWPYTFSGGTIPKLTDKEIEIQLYYTDGFPLADGSYAGIKFQHSTDNVNWEDFALTIPSSYEYIDNKYSRCLIYTFPTPLSKGTHYFKVTNKPYGKEEFTASVKVVINPKTVTFDGRTSIKTLVVEAGQAILESEKPANPNPSGNYFMYWSKSKASLAEAVEFDFSQPITEDITLYAIYKPKLYYLSSSIINKITRTQIEIKLYNKDVFPLDDGSYPGIIIQRGSSSSNLTELKVENIPSYRDDSSYRYLTYTFANNFTLPEGTHYFKVTNGEETSSTKNITLTSPKEATGLKADTADSYAKISFKAAVDGWSYKVAALKNSEELASKTIAVNSDETGEVEFFGLKNDTEYTFKVTTDGSDKSAEIKATPAIPITKKESDWLVLMYMDGDNNLHNSIYLDLNEAENGLNYIRSSDGSANSSYDSVNVVTLWDGATSWEDKDDDGNPVTETPAIGESGSYLFELGADTYSTSSITSSAYVLSNKTKNLSYTADWLCPTKTESTNQKAYYGEVNMGNKQTLINFLNWAQAHYTATKGIILQFSNHGGGPRSIMYAEDAEGRTYKIGDDGGRRALCWDDTSGKNAFLKTKDVSDALTTAGFTGTNKLSMILMDVCLGSSLEDAYQFRNNAEYLAASPNNIPGSGLDYRAFMKSFAKNTTIENFGKQLVIDYKNQYTASSIRDRLWDNYAQYVYDTTYSNLTANQKKALEWFGDSGITTFTITDLSKVANIKDKLDALCNILLSETGKAKTIYVGDDGDFSPTATSKTENYVKYLGSQHADRLSQKYINNSIYYLGSFTWLYDIGYFADRVQLTSTSNLKVNGVSTNNANAWTELYNAATDLKNALGTGSDRAIRYSWRDSKLSTASNYDFYYELDTNSEYQHPYGLSIAGYGIAVNAGSIVKGTVPDWYKTALAFGADSKWGDLLAYWFNN